MVHELNDGHIAPFLEDEDLFILHIQYHSCCGPSHARRRGICSNGSYQFVPGNSGFTTRRVEISYSIIQLHYDLIIYNMIVKTLTADTLISKLYGENMGCLLWIQSVTYVVILSL